MDATTPGQSSATDPTSHQEAGPPPEAVAEILKTRLLVSTHPVTKQLTFTPIDPGCSIVNLKTREGVRAVAKEMVHYDDGLLEELVKLASERLERIRAYRNGRDPSSEDRLRRPACTARLESGLEDLLPIHLWEIEGIFDLIRIAANDPDSDLILQNTVAPMIGIGLDRTVELRTAMERADEMRGRTQTQA